MPRPLRRAEAGTIFHVLNRGNGRGLLFHKDEDFAAFVRLLAQGVARYPVDVLAYCLMGNHWHLLLRPRTDAALPRLMGWLATTHARRLHAHRRDRAGGHLYQGRYKSFPVQDDAHFLTVARYVHANPLRARLVTRAQAWRWSSLRGGATGGPPMAPWPLERPRNWLALVNAAIDERQLSTLRASVTRGRPFGSERWVLAAAKRLQLMNTMAPRGRPRKPIEKLSPRQRRRRRAEGGQK
jgi:putative transposase